VRRHWLWSSCWFKGGVGPGVLAAAYLAATQTGRSYVVAAVAENPSQPIAEGADLGMLAAIRGALAEHVRAFADLLTTRRGADLEDWMSAIEESDLPLLHAFVRGLRKDLDAVVAGLSLPYSNGPIEGTNTKFKLLKRQMYGRAGFALLRQRILLS
jgi:hypothetical protein